MDLKEAELILNRMIDETRSVIIRCEGHVNLGWEHYLHELEYATGDIKVSLNLEQFLILVALSRNARVGARVNHEIDEYEMMWRIKAIDDIQFRLDVGE